MVLVVRLATKVSTGGAVGGFVSLILFRGPL